MSARSTQWAISDALGRTVATYGMGSVSAIVENADDRAVFEVRQRGEVIASGGDPDIDGSIEAVEEVLVAIGWLVPPSEQDAA